MNQANSRIEQRKQKEINADDNDVDVDDNGDNYEKDENNTSLPPTLTLWTNQNHNHNHNKKPPPSLLYEGPMAIIQTQTSNRGLVATQNVKPGTLLLVETPIFTWTDAQIGSELNLNSIVDIFHHECAIDIIRDMELLYPTKQEVDDIVRVGRQHDRHQRKKKCSFAQDSSEKVQIYDMIEIMEMIHGDSKELELVLQLAKSMSMSMSLSSSQKNKDCDIDMDDMDNIDEIDIMRMLLVLRYNSFDSGLYLKFAMFNHDEDPNCIKFIPESNQKHDHDSVPSTSSNNGQQQQQQQQQVNTQEHRPYYSEVRTTKYVKKGEALTLYYMNPREVSHATRRLHIWDQHRFDIGEDMKQIHKGSNDDNNEDDDDKMKNGILEEMEYVNGTFPISSKEEKNNTRPTLIVENAISDLEQLRNEIDVVVTTLLSSLNSNNNHPSPKQQQNNIDEDTGIELFERCKALEMAADELIQATKLKLENDKHVLLIRCCRLHLDSAEILLRFTNRGRGHGYSSTQQLSLSSKQQLDIMCRFVRTCHILLPLQINYLGTHHPDIARTNYDYAMAINSLLSRAPKRIFELGLEGLHNFDSCQRLEAKCRKEHIRIDGLYPRDATEKIHEFQKKIEMEIKE
mmetsp:Transcript_20034/g.23196  ORF Transcript_20034/g.23196 Transcript_20034/m.23196 type:complete len:626 (-) Transcript_20034:201-2078(-)